MQTTQRKVRAAANRSLVVMVLVSLVAAASAAKN
jgi:hypothetical protein